MKPIEKYQQRFIELLKEAEKELGGALTVTVRDRVIYQAPALNGISAVIQDVPEKSRREYSCSIGTAGMECFL